MSRIGKQIITLPKGVTLKVADGMVHVQGPKGSLTKSLDKGVKVTIENNEVVVSLEQGFDEMTNIQGLFRSLINNMVVGVSDGFTKTLEMVGVGFRAAVKGNEIDLQLGYSHPTLISIPQGITVTVEKNTTIHLSGSDKHAIGQFAATIRDMRKPEPYKGKGIKYKDEYIRRKAGKTAK